ncbi:MAG: CDGSH iron-sulfur domain-containing protein [Bacteroidales bacterium]|jgi:CDGSH-type Zn-finger protein|nr:CDGSH iron-sulfur domain-containing protein [Bacteroidales bacterium]
MATKEDKKVKILKDGPYEVSGNVPLDQLQFTHNDRGFSLEYEKINDYKTDEPYHLCRCGKSNNKPFCDGSHLKGFDGTETASHEKYDETAKFIEGKLIDLKDMPELCAGARFCDTKSGTWNLVEKAENEDAKDIIKHQCTHCPSGRLVAVTKEGEVIEPKLPQEISILKDSAFRVDGPIYVKGGIPVEDVNGKIYPERNRVTLCRCGKSKNKPFCDASHLRK